MPDRINRAKELLRTVRHAAMATVNEDGSPHNTPYFFARSPDLAHLYWRSRAETQHSQNIGRTGQLFVVLYEAAGNGNGLYIKARNARVAEGAELDEAIAAFSAARAAAGKPVIDPATYKSSAPKFYVADIETIWVNEADSDQNGVIIRDYREQVTIASLLDDQANTVL